MQIISFIFTFFCFYFTFITCSVSEEVATPSDSILPTATTPEQDSSTSTSTPEDKPKAKPIKVKRTKKNTKDWDKLSENDLEKDWEQGDDSVELEHEFERIQKVQAKKSQKMSTVLDTNDPAQISKLIQSGGLEQKGGMFFITLKPKQPDGSDWTTAAQDKLASYWSALLRTNSLSGNVFNLEPGQMLVSVDKGWLMKEVMDFVLTREEVVKITKDNKDHFPKPVDSDEDEL